MAQVVLSDDQLHKIQSIEIEVLCEVDRICKANNINYTLGFGTLLGAVRHKGFIPWDDDIDICMPRRDYIRFKKICEKELSKKYFYQSQSTDPEYFHLFDKIRVNQTVFKEDFLAEYHIHHGVYIDIFPMDYIPENKVLRYIQFVRFHFFRIGLMSKYLSIKQRKGKKLIAARLMRIVYAPFSLKWLYTHANKTAMKYDDKEYTYIFHFCNSINGKFMCKSDSLINTIEMSFENHKFPVPKEYDEVLTNIYGNYMQLPPESERQPKHHLEALKI